MSEIHANIVVQPLDITVQVDNPGITVNPDVIGLNIYAVGGTNGIPAGNIGDLQYNEANGFAAIPSNIANYTSGNLNLSVANTKIPGGTNGYVLQTDGTGNLSWVAAGTGSGNGIPGGANTQVQFNDSGLFGGVTGFTFDKVTGNLAIPGNLTIGGNVIGPISANYANFAGTIVNNAQPNITSIGNLTTLNVSSYINTANVYASAFNGNLYGAATTAGTVTTNAQPNITSIGTLANLSVAGGTSVVYAKENLSITTSPSSSYNLDVITSPIHFVSANASSNISLNIRGNSTVTFDSLISNNQSITVSFVMKTGTSVYGVSSVSIDGTSVTPKYAGTTISSANSIITYTYTIIKNSGTYNVLGSTTRYI